AVSGLLAETASRPWTGRHADQVDLRAHSPLITRPWSPSSFRHSLVRGWRVSGRPGWTGRRARQRAGVEEPDLEDPLGELPRVAGAVVAPSGCRTRRGWWTSARTPSSVSTDAMRSRRASSPRR